jgi:tetratricopeptide (TPR) repeat protein
LPEVRESVSLFLAAARSDPTRTEGLLGAVKAQAWLVDHESAASEREARATDAVQSAQWCARIDPQSAACEYWLGAALGLQAREKPSTALDALPRIEQAFRHSAEMSPALEEGGPHRALALLYARAPAWPTGPGDPDRAVEEARLALGIAPDYPPNLLALGEALHHQGDAAASREAYARALDLAQARALQEDPDATEWIEAARKGLDSKSSNP